MTEFEKLMADGLPVDAAWSGLEPGCAKIAKGARRTADANQLIFLSAATSLKRIADFLTGDYAAGGSDPAANNLNNLLADRFHDLAQSLRNN